MAAGAWAAFLSTSSGLVVSIAGVLSTDVLRSGRGVRDFRVATVIAGAVPLILSIAVTRLDFAEAVALVFAVAASTFCPLLVLGIWWSGLTDRGAIAGVLVGGLVSAGAVAASLAGVGRPDWTGVLLNRPAVLTVPLAFLVMVVVQPVDRATPPAGHRPGDAAAARAGAARAQPGPAQRATPALGVLMERRRPVTPALRFGVGSATLRARLAARRPFDRRWSTLRPTSPTVAAVTRLAYSELRPQLILSFAGSPTRRGGGSREHDG